MVCSVVDRCDELAIHNTMQALSHAIHTRSFSGSSGDEAMPAQVVLRSCVMTSSNELSNLISFSMWSLSLSDSCLHYCYKALVCKRPICFSLYICRPDAIKQCAWLLLVDTEVVQLKHCLYQMGLLRDVNAQRPPQYTPAPH
eukprot:11626-Heterococcus_DN1.PRE.2